MSSQLHIDSVKKLLSEGKTESAVDAMIQITEQEHLNQYNQSSILLKNRIENLQQQIIEGTISQADSTLEWAKTSKAVMLLATTVEHKIVLQKVSSTTSKPIFSFPTVSLPWKKIAAYTLPSLLAFSLFYRFVVAPPKPSPFDLNITIKSNQPIKDIHDLKLKIKMGETVLSEKNIAINQTISYSNVDGNLKKKAISLELSDTLSFHLVNQSSFTAAQNPNISVELIPNATLYKGKIVHFDNSPARKVVIDFERGLIRDTTDNDGNYEVLIPNTFKEGEHIFLTINDINGATIYSQKIILDENLLKLRKIH
jgi:Effector-associated domain 11